MNAPDNTGPLSRPVLVAPAETAQRQQTLILVGNANVGKSVLFGKLTGKFVVISNYPGTTVELTHGTTVIDGHSFDVVDTPGINDLSPRTEDARVTCDVLRDHPEAIVVQVADAKNLRRALLLTGQLAELHRPQVLVLNMMDELDQCGGRIDVRKLSSVLGIPVVPTIATAGTGIHLLQKSVTLAAPARFAPPGPVDHRPTSAASVVRRGSPDPAASVVRRGSPDPAASVVRRGSPDPAVPPDRQVSRQQSDDLRSTTGTAPADNRPAAADGGERSYEATTACLQRVSEILAETYTLIRPHRPSFAQKLGWWATDPFKGLLLLAAVLYFTFWFVGLLGAGVAVDFFQNVVFGRYVNPWAIRAVDTLLPFPHEHLHQTSRFQLNIPLAPARGIRLRESSVEVLASGYVFDRSAPRPWPVRARRFLHDFLVGEYGVITMAVSYALAIVLPIVTTFCLLFSVLEDCGYLPRLAIMVHRLWRWMGLNGKAVLPMVLGLGCDTMATMTTRILETRKERVITTLLLALAVPCSAQLGVLLAMMACISFRAALFWLALLLAIMLAVGWLAARLLGGETSDFILEIPPMRRPQLANVVIKTFARLEWYLKEVVPLFVVGTAILFALDKLDVLGGLARLGEPLVTGWLGLPRETANAFLIGFLRRDYGAVYLLDAATGPGARLTPHQVLVAMVTITLFMPCIATVFMISRELGKKTAAAITLFVFPFAFLVGGLVHQLGHWIGL